MSNIYDKKRAAAINAGGASFAASAGQSGHFLWKLQRPRPKLPPEIHPTFGGLVSTWPGSRLGAERRAAPFVAQGWELVNG